MPEFTMRLAPKGLLLSTCLCLLTACSGSTALSPPKIERSNPIDNQALTVQNLLSFDVYVDQHTLHALFAASTDNPQQPYIGYLRSDDDGAHWNSVVELGHYVDLALESKIGNDVQIAASGKQLMAVWQVRGELPGMGPLQVLSSGDGGNSWSPGNNPTASDTDQSHADLAADEHGRFHLVWLDDRDENGYQGLRYARSEDAGQHWRTQTLDDSSCSCCWNRLLITADDHLHVLYRDMEPRDMALAQSTDGGDSWQRTGTVGAFNWHFDGCPHNGGGLTASDPQHLYSLVWTGADDRAGLYHLQSADAGKSWSPPQAMISEQPGFHSDIAAGNDGRVIAIWDTRGAKSEVVFSISADHGQHWTEPQALSPNGNATSFPRLVATSSGWLAMWMEQQPGAGKRWQSALIQ
jgi:hypothetical protein